MERDWALRKAEELVKATKPAGAIKTDFKERSICVGSEIVFTQDADELARSFCGACAHLRLP